MTKRRPPYRLTLALLAALLGLGHPALAQQKAAALFGAERAASPHKPQAIGTYSNGCAAGLVRLPENGPTWQAMRLSRNRNWGHPNLIAFVERISAFAAQQPGWAGLYIGDLSQPRGGPMTSGHASHQIGLDADIWMLPPKSLALSRAEREKISSITVRTADQRNVNRNWTPQHMAIVEAAARDPAVDRIFITAPAKIQLCLGAKRGDRAWLQKVRPYWGHDYHFHVRLKCPAGDRACITQKPSVAELSKGGDGCDATLNWWVTDALNPPKTPAKPAQPAPKRKGARDFTLADLPGECRTVLAAR
ncbi:MAG: penicillin-insensitive murein endopeptidase [Qingshengfaniella sp.]